MEKAFSTKSFKIIILSSEKNFYTWFHLFSENVNIPKLSKSALYFLSFTNYKNNKLPENKFIIYEDWWLLFPEIVKSKIYCFFGKANRIFARKCVIKKIDKLEATTFLTTNHLHGSVKSKVQYGLFYQEKLVAVATFANSRNFISGKSAELLRFSSLNYTLIVGGLSKIISTYIQDYQPNNIMTYIDKDWGNGQGFKKIGFKEKVKKGKLLFYCNKTTGKRTKASCFNDFENKNLYAEIENTGSIKMVLNCNL